jgi:hypothetical protein
MLDGLPGYWYSRIVFERSLAVIYLVALVCAANQFAPLRGEHGLMPVSRFVRVVSFRAAPSLFFFLRTDAAFRAGQPYGAERVAVLDHPWFTALLVKRLEGDRAVLGLFRNDSLPRSPSDLRSRALLRVPFHAPG